MVAGVVGRRRRWPGLAAGVAMPPPAGLLLGRPARAGTMVAVAAAALACRGEGGVSGRPAEARLGGFPAWRARLSALSPPFQRTGTPPQASSGPGTARPGGAAPSPGANAMDAEPAGACRVVRFAAGSRAPSSSAAADPTLRLGARRFCWGMWRTVGGPARMQGRQVATHSLSPPRLGPGRERGVRAPSPNWK